jgi:hypothetical protein
VEEASFDKVIRAQDMAVNALSPEHVARIATNNMDAVDSFDKEQPKSALIGYRIPEHGGGPFHKADVVLISTIVAEKIYTKFITHLWQTMLRLGTDGWKIFEAYTRAIMANGDPVKLQRGRCVGKGDPAY